MPLREEVARKDAERRPYHFDYAYAILSKLQLCVSNDT